MTTDTTAPATKRDIAKLYRANERWKDELKEHVDAANRQTKDELKQWKGELHQWKDEMKQHFDVAVENFRYDLRTINLEKMGDHEQRIILLEIQTGLRK